MTGIMNHVSVIHFTIFLAVCQVINYFVVTQSTIELLIMYYV